MEINNEKLKSRQKLIRPGLSSGVGDTIDPTSFSGSATELNNPKLINIRLFNIIKVDTYAAFLQ